MFFFLFSGCCVDATVVAAMESFAGAGRRFLAALYCSSSSFASCSCMFAGDAVACTSAMFVLLRAGLLMSRSKAGSCGRSGVEREGRSYIPQRLK